MRHKGSLNVLKACKNLGVKLIILMSNIRVIYLNPNRIPQAIVDEDYWINLDYCIQAKEKYLLCICIDYNFMERFLNYKSNVVKYSSSLFPWLFTVGTVAEKVVSAYAEEVGIELIRINPNILLDYLL